MTQETGQPKQPEFLKDFRRPPQGPCKSRTLLRPPRLSTKDNINENPETLGLTDLLLKAWTDSS